MKIKELRLVNNGFPYILTDDKCDMTLFSKRRWMGHPGEENFFGNQKAKHTIAYEIAITAKIDMDKIHGVLFSDEWIKSVADYKNNSQKYKDTSTYLENNFFNTRMSVYDEVVEFMTEDGNIYTQEVESYDKMDFIHFNVDSDNDIKPKENNVWMGIAEMLVKHANVCSFTISEIDKNSCYIKNNNTIIGKLNLIKGVNGSYYEYIGNDGYYFTEYKSGSGILHQIYHVVKLD